MFFNEMNNLTRNDSELKKCNSNNPVQRNSDNKSQSKSTTHKIQQPKCKCGKNKIKYFLKCSRVLPISGFRHSSVNCVRVNFPRNGTVIGKIHNH